MHLSELTIINYRNFKNEKFIFNEGVNTVIGENGSGKTNMFHALRIMLDSSLPRNATRFAANDFNRSLKGDWKGHWIILQICFASENPILSETINSLLYHNLETGEKKCTYTLIFRPNKRVRQNLHRSSAEDRSQIIENITIDDYNVEYFGKTEVDLTENSNYQMLVGDFLNLSFPDPDGEHEKVLGSKIPPIFDLQNEFSFTFIPAIRDVVKDFKRNPRNPLSNLLSLKSQEINDFESIVEHAKSLNNLISISKDVDNLKEQISLTYQNTVGSTYAPEEVEINSELPEDAESLFKNLVLYICETGTGYKRSLDEISLGEANMVFISLKLMEFEYATKDNKIKNFLIIEEPESHIHTHIQRTLFSKVNYNNTQIIYSTHSTQISSVSNIENVNIINQFQDRWVVNKPSNGLTKEETFRSKRYLDAKRSDALFAKGIILVEGDAEEILVPEMIRKNLGISIDEIGISLINVGSTGFDNIARLFHQERINKYCSIITDNDLGIRVNMFSPVENIKQTPEARKLFAQKISFIKDSENEDHLKEISKQISSEASGRIRKKNLDDCYTNNEFVNIYYAENTFEIDFALTDVINRNIINESVKCIYSNQKKILEYQDLINSGLSYEIGETVLKLAKKHGKGWFALEMTKFLKKDNFFIPQYIIEAIVNAAANIDIKLIDRISAYRGYSNKTEVIDIFNSIFSGNDSPDTLTRIQHVDDKSIMQILLALRSKKFADG